jgi:hypothetical protein
MNNLLLQSAAGAADDVGEIFDQSAMCLATTFHASTEMTPARCLSITSNAAAWQKCHF